MWVLKRLFDGFISTHSLTRRLTLFCICCNFSKFISTHSLTRRLTCKQATELAYLKHFNSQPHKEADPVTMLLCSVHRHFNSQPHKEADDDYTSFEYRMIQFQLTASQGG